MLSRLALLRGWLRSSGAGLLAWRSADQPLSTLNICTALLQLHLRECGTQCPAQIPIQWVLGSVSKKGNAVNVGQTLRGAADHAAPARQADCHFGASCFDKTRKRRSATLPNDLP